MQNDLVRALNEAGKTTRTHEFPDGTRVLLMPYGARILGLYAEGSDANFFWTHPALASPDSAISFYNSSQWHNSGGERTWLAPELDVFFPDYPDLETHRPPAELDAADYTILRTEAGHRMERKITLDLARSGQKVEVIVAKSVSPGPNPLRYERSSREERDAVRYGGYTQTTSLEIIGDHPDVPLSPWNLIQLRHGGEMLIPIYSDTSVRVFFGNPSSRDLITTDRLIRFKARASGEHKIAIRATASTGRAGYLSESDAGWELVIRNFFVNPSGKYLDCPKDDPEDLGYAFEAVSVDSSLGKFSELEYHVPAQSGLDSVSSRCEDVSQVWAFRGPHQAIQKLARRLLSPEV